MNQNDFRMLIKDNNHNANKLNKNDKQRINNLANLSNDIQLLGQSKGLNLDEINKQKSIESEQIDNNIQLELDSVINEISPSIKTSNKRSRNDILVELKRSKLHHQNKDIELPSSSSFKPPSPEALDSDDDIFNDTNDNYQPPQLSDSDVDSVSNSNSNNDNHFISQNIESPQQSPSQPQYSLSPSPSPELDEYGRLVGLSSSALPNVTQRIQHDKDAEFADQRKQRKQIWLAKQGIKKDTGEASEPLPEKTQTESQKLNSDYQRYVISLFQNSINLTTLYSQN